MEAVGSCTSFIRPPFRYRPCLLANCPTGERHASQARRLPRSGRLTATPPIVGISERHGYNRAPQEEVSLVPMSLSRRSFVARTAGLAVAAALAPLVDKGSLVPTTTYAAAADNASRAADAYNAMQKHFY